MTKWDQNNLPNKVTVKAIATLLSLFTDKDKQLLELNRNNQKVTLAEQFLARWWNHIPLADSPVVFRASALKILDANRRIIDLIEKISQDDLFAALLDPKNYKESNRKRTKYRMNDKRQAVAASTTGNIVKSIARATYGNAALGGTFDYSKEWDKTDRKRMDQMVLQHSQPNISSTKKEQEEGDDTFIDPNTERKIDPDDEWSIENIDAKTRLDYKTIEENSVNVNVSKFMDSIENAPDEKGILLHTANIGHQANATTGQTGSTSNSFIEALKRQNYETLRERLILADAINNIQNLEFVDLREKLYKKFDDLFYIAKKICR